MRAAFLPLPRVFVKGSAELILSWSPSRSRLLTKIRWNPKNRGCRASCRGLRLAILTDINSKRFLASVHFRTRPSPVHTRTTQSTKTTRRTRSVPIVTATALVQLNRPVAANCALESRRTIDNEQRNPPCLQLQTQSLPGPLVQFEWMPRMDYGASALLRHLPAHLQSISKVCVVFIYVLLLT